MKSSLEYDLLKTEWIAYKCQKLSYAIDLYGALCNNRFFKDNQEWTCSWRESGAIIAELRNQGETYLHFYCSGNESLVTEEISNDLLNLGWSYKPYEPRLQPGLYRNDWGEFTGQ